MEFLIGTEMRDDYLSFEVARAARKTIDEVHEVNPGDNVVITCDTAGDSRVVNAFAQAVYAKSAHPVVIWYETQPDAQMEPPAPVAAALTKADVWFEFGVQYILYTDARIQATKSGCRHACYGGMDVEMLVRTIGRVDYPLMDQLGKKLRELCMAAKEVRITDPNGTDLLCPTDPNPPAYLPGAGQPGQGFSRMLGGQGGFSSLVDQINGVMVFDGAIWPPAEIGPLDAPVTLTVENGYVTKIEGGPQAQIFERWMAQFDNRQMYRIAHLSFGFNPGVKGITGRIVEDERVFGCMDIGIGPQNLGAPSHTDGIILRPSLIADGVEIERDGRYVHPELVDLCKQLGVS